MLHTSTAWKSLSNVLETQQGKKYTYGLVDDDDDKNVLGFNSFLRTSALSGSVLTPSSLCMVNERIHNNLNGNIPFFDHVGMCSSDIFPFDPESLFSLNEKK